MKEILLIIIFLSGAIFSQELTGDNPYKVEFKKDPLNYRSLPTVFYRASDTTYWSPVHVDGVMKVAMSGTTTDTAVVLVDSTNATVQSSYVYFSMNSFKYAAIAVNFDDSTSSTFYSSIYSDADTTDETSGDWGDITNAIVGADSVAFGANTNYYITDALFPNALILIKYNKWGDTNSIKIGVKKGY